MTGDLVRIFLHVIVPVMLVAGAGYAVGRVRQIDLGPVIGLAVSVLVPAIVFDSLTRAALPPALLGRLVLHVVLQLVCLGALALVVAWLIGWRGPSRAALLMATLFSNGGNTGLPVALFAFGPAGLAIAGGWFAASAVAGHTLGVYISARAHAGGRAALVQLLRQPITYAIVAGVVVNLAGWPVPTPIGRAVELVGAGGLAIMLLLVGLQLARLAPRAELPGATLASAIRLLAAPPVAWLTGTAIGLHGLALSVVVVQASMPTAVTAAMWAMEFDARPSLVAATVLVSTLASIVTLTVLLAMLL